MFHSFFDGLNGSSSFNSVFIFIITVMESVLYWWLNLLQLFRVGWLWEFGSNNSLSLLNGVSGNINSVIFILQVSSFGISLHVLKLLFWGQVLEFGDAGSSS